MSDREMKLTVHTEEIDTQDKAELMNLHNAIGHFVFSTTGIEEEDIPDEPVRFEGQKTLSERLRMMYHRRLMQTT